MNWTTSSSTAPAATSSRRASLGHRRGCGLASLLDPQAAAAARPASAAADAGGPLLAGRRTSPRGRKRVIYLFQSGGPSQLDLFDYKPLLQRDERRGAARLGPRWASGSPA